MKDFMKNALVAFGSLAIAATPVPGQDGQWMVEKGDTLSGIVKESCSFKDWRQATVYRNGQSRPEAKKADLWEGDIVHCSSASARVEAEKNEDVFTGCGNDPGDQLAYIKASLHDGDFHWYPNKDPVRNSECRLLRAVGLAMYAFEEIKETPKEVAAKLLGQSNATVVVNLDRSIDYVIMEDGRRIDIRKTMIGGHSQIWWNGKLYLAEGENLEERRATVVRLSNGRDIVMFETCWNILTGREPHSFVSVPVIDQPQEPVVVTEAEVIPEPSKWKCDMVSTFTGSWVEDSYYGGNVEVLPCEYRINDTNTIRPYGQVGGSVVDTKSWRERGHREFAGIWWNHTGVGAEAIGASEVTSIGAFGQICAGDGQTPNGWATKDGECVPALYGNVGLEYGIGEDRETRLNISFWGNLPIGGEGREVIGLDGTSYGKAKIEPTYGVSVTAAKDLPEKNWGPWGTFGLFRSGDDSYVQALVGVGWDKGRRGHVGVGVQAALESGDIRGAAEVQLNLWATMVGNSTERSERFVFGDYDDPSEDEKRSSGVVVASHDPLEDILWWR